MTVDVASSGQPRHAANGYFGVMAPFGRSEDRSPQKTCSRSAENPDLIYRDPAMAAVVERARRAAASDASVLISGESGTGKEVIARFIHTASNRSRGPFIALNCAAIPENLLESELFGYERGAFSGAISSRIGKLEAADGGTILLDEISEMDVRLQAKLLRAVQEREVDRVGALSPRKINIRIIATTNKDLDAEIKRHAFREDLYFRLNVIPIHLPGLRDRPHDIPELARHFIRKYDCAGEPRFSGFSEASTAKMLAYHWPGNVRELENAVSRAIVLATPEEIKSRYLDFNATPVMVSRSTATMRVPTSGMIGRPLHEIERDVIIATLTMAGGNRTRAADILDISIRCLRNKLQLYKSQGVISAIVSADLKL